MLRFTWHNQPYRQLEGSLTIDNREKGKEERVERKGGVVEVRQPSCLVLLLGKKTFLIWSFYAKREAKSTDQTSHLLFYSSSSPLPASSYKNLLCFFPLYLCAILLSSLRVICLPCLGCLLSNWYERVTLRLSGVKWYKVIGRSSLLTGWPLKRLLEGANQT